MKSRLLAAALMAVFSTVITAAETQTHVLLVESKTGVSGAARLEMSKAGDLKVTLISNDQQFRDGAFTFSTPAKLTITGTEGVAVLSSIAPESSDIVVKLEVEKSITRASGSEVRFHIISPNRLSFVSDQIESTPK